jgi:hypothetical protein
MEPTKREFRQLKREIKRAGSQHRRRQWKRDLRDNPEEAPYSEERFGRFSTAEMNGNDKPRVREKPRREESPSSDLDEAVEPSEGLDLS